MTYLVQIDRYHNGRTLKMEAQIPNRVTTTGNEDHFHRAYEDAHMMIAGMRAFDDAEWERATKEAEEAGDKPPTRGDVKVHYRIKSLREM